MSSDPFGLHEAAGFFLFVAVVAALYGLSRLWARRHKTPSTPTAETSPFLGTWECWVAYCDRAADTWVVNPHAGELFVCTRCAHQGATHGWWAIVKRPAA